ncbi:MAG: PH domain-containing protein [Specibacter sp.]
MRRWLADGEQVQSISRPHSRILIAPLSVGLLLVMGTSAALAKLQPGEYAGWAADFPQLREPAVVLLLTAVILVGIAYPLRRVIRWANTHYILTSQRLVVRRGGLRRRQEDHVLAQMQGMDVRQKVRQRMVGSGDLELHMANGSIRTVHEVPNIHAFRNYAQEQWMKLFRASLQQAPGLGYYAEDVDFEEAGMIENEIGKELRKLGRDH